MVAKEIHDLLEKDQIVALVQLPIRIAYITTLLEIVSNIAQDNGHQALVEPVGGNWLVVVKGGSHGK